VSTTGKVLVGGLIGVLVAAGAGVLWFFAMLSGGWDDLIGHGPSAKDRDVVAAIAQSHQRNQQELDELLRDVVRPAMGARVPTLATATADGCDPGQHNYKRDDSYHLLCTVGDAVLLTGTTAALHDQMLGLGRALAARPPWSGDQAFPVPRVVGQYWDVRASRPDAASYGPSDLPEARYDGDQAGLVLHLTWVDAFDPAVSLSSFTGRPRWRSAEGKPLTAAEVLDLLPAGLEYGLLVEVERTAIQKR
jgi:hypothetical protein